MSDPPIRPEPGRFSDADLRRILARAAELDQHLPEALTGAGEKELHEIARELGISGVAISAALREPRTAAFEPSGHDGRLRGLQAAAQSALIGAVPGAAAGMMRIFDWPGELAWLILGAAYGCSLALALRVRGPDKQYRFQMRNLGLWIGFGVSLSAIMGPAEDLLLVLWVWGTTAAAGGGVIVWFRELWAKQRRGIIGRLRALAERHSTEATGDHSSQEHTKLRLRLTVGTVP